MEVTTLAQSKVSLPRLPTLETELLPLVGYQEGDDQDQEDYDEGDHHSDD